MRTSIDDRELIEQCHAYLLRLRHLKTLARQHEHAWPGTDVQDRLDAEIGGAELVRLEIAAKRPHTVAGMRAKSTACAASLDGDAPPPNVELIESLLSDLNDPPSVDPDEPAEPGPLPTQPAPARKTLLWASASGALAVAVGVGVLQYMGPPPHREPGDQTPAEGQQSTASTERQSVAAPTAAPTSLTPTTTAPEQQPSVPDPPPVGPPALAMVGPAPVPAAPAPLAPVTVSPLRPSSGQQSPQAGAVGPVGSDRNGAQRRDRPFVILYAARPEDARAVAEQMSSLAGVAVDRIDTISSGALPSRAIIRFNSEEDHAAVRRVGQQLAQLGYSWEIQNLSSRASAPDRPLVEVWLPRR